ncbi:MAG: hypothetical protein GEU97_24235 [Actinophytocola sp.]|nr:hypothetical protein [Actinophytocola sp.]
MTKADAGASQPNNAPEPDDSLSLSGMDVRPGDHVCAFYRDASERDAIVVPFLLDGLKAGDKCTYVVDGCEPQQVVGQFDAEAPTDDYLLRGQLEVLDSASTYLADGEFLPERMLAFWEERAQASLGADYAFCRNAGDMSWAHSTPFDVSLLTSYEAELNRFIPRHPQVNLCLYDVSRCPGELVLDVLKTHPKVLLGRMVLENPYYLQPDQFMAAQRGPG